MAYRPTKPLDFASADFSLRVGVGTGGRWKSGYRSSFDLDVGNIPQLIWPLSTIMIFPTVADTLLITSTSSADALAGTGAQRIFILGLDADYNIISETVDTNGIIGVTTTLSYLRLNSAICLDAGSSNANVGDISLASTGTGDVIGYIPNNLGKHISSVATAPGNRWFGINDFYAEVAGDDTLEILFESRSPGKSWRAIETVVIPTAGNIARHWHDTAPIMIQPMADLRILANKVGGGQTTSCSVSYNFYSIDSREVTLVDDILNV